VVDGAFDVLMAGDLSKHDAMVSAEICRAAEHADVGGTGTSKYGAAGTSIRGQASCSSSFQPKPRGRSVEEGLGGALWVAMILPRLDADHAIERFPSGDTPASLICRSIEHFEI